MVRNVLKIAPCRGCGEQPSFVGNDSRCKYYCECEGAPEMTDFYTINHCQIVWNKLQERINGYEDI